MPSTPPPRRRTGLVLDILFGLVVLVLFFGLTEIAARLVSDPAPPSPGQAVTHQIFFNNDNQRDETFVIQPDPVLGYRLAAPAAEGTFVDSRGRVFARQKPPDVLRVVCLGGSTTYGVGVDDRRYAYPALLQRLFDLSLSGRPVRVEVINAGMMGYHGWHSLIRVATELGELSPDLYLVMDGLNDVCAIQGLRDPKGLGDEKARLLALVGAPRTDGDMAARLLGLLERSAFFRLLRQAATRLDALRDNREALWRESFEAFGYTLNLRRLIDVTATQGSRVAVLDYPWIVLPGRSYDEEARRIAMPLDRGVFELYRFGRAAVGQANREVCQETGATLIEARTLFDALAAGGEDPRRLYAGDLSHLTMYGNYLLAREAFARLTAPGAPLSGPFEGRAGPDLLALDSDPVSQYCVNWGHGSRGLGSRGFAARALSGSLKLGQGITAAESSNPDLRYLESPDRTEALLEVRLNDPPSDREVVFFPRVANYGDAVRVSLVGKDGERELFCLEKPIQDGVWTPFESRYGLRLPEDAGPSPVLRARLTGWGQIGVIDGSVFFRAD